MNKNSKGNFSVQEVEKRALLKESDYKEILKKLDTLGAKLIKKVNINDIYFCPITVLSFAEIEMDHVNSYSLRLREQNSDYNKEVTLNVKLITQEGDHSSWEEHEVVVGSFNTTTNILKSIGFKQFCTIKKSRLVYNFNDIEVSIEDIVDFGLGIEAEVKTSTDQSTKAKAKIDELFEKLEINSDQIVEKSITNIIMRKKSKF